MKKRCGILLLALVMALSLTLLAGCAGEEPAGQPSESSSQPESEQASQSSGVPEEESGASVSSPESGETEESSEASPESSASQSAPQSQDPSSQDTAGEDSRLVANDGALFGSAEQEVLGTGEDLEKWTAAAADMSGVSHLLVSTFSDPRVLTQEEVQTILDTLAGLSPQVLEEKGNPPTGGNANIIAYDAAGQELWRATVNESWLIVRVAPDTTPRLFGIEGQAVDELLAING